MQNNTTPTASETAANNSLGFIIKRSIRQSHGAFKEVWGKCFLYMLLAGIIGGLIIASMGFMALENANAGVPYQAQSNIGFLLLAIIMNFIYARLAALILPICQRYANHKTTADQQNTVTEQPKNHWVITMRIFTIYMIIFVAHLIISILAGGQDATSTLSNSLNNTQLVTGTNTHSMPLSTKISLVLYLFTVPFLLFAVIETSLKNQHVSSSIKNAWKNYCNPQQFWQSLFAFWGAYIAIVLTGIAILGAGFLIYTTFMSTSSPNSAALSLSGIVSGVTLLLAAALAFYIVTCIMLASYMAVILIYQRLEARIQASK